MPITRQPVQQRSIETKQKIINAGYKLFETLGYHKTNTASIAKTAQVSTGIVYGYFKDKKDILKEVLNEYIKKVYNPIFDLIDNLAQKQNIDFMINKVLDLAEKLHKESCDMHRELAAVAGVDEDINNTFLDLQDVVTEKFVQKLKILKYENITNENIHLAMNLIESYVHEVVYDNHKYINYSKLRESVIFLIKTLFSKG